MADEKFAGLPDHLRPNTAPGIGDRAKDALRQATCPADCPIPYDEDHTHADPEALFRDEVEAQYGVSGPRPYVGGSQESVVEDGTAAPGTNPTPVLPPPIPFRLRRFRADIEREATADGEAMADLQLEVLLDIRDMLEARADIVQVVPAGTLTFEPGEGI